jgi:hypothetical protein
MGCYRGSGTTIRHITKVHVSHKITHHSNYTNNGLTTHNEYNTKTKVKLSLQDCEMSRILHCPDNRRDTC